MSEAFPFPFVVGSVRSGTSLVRSMLDAHPELAIPGESHFVARLAGELRPFSAPAFLDAVLADERVRRWSLVEEDVRARFSDSPPADYPDAVRLLYSCYARARGKARYGDKTPLYVRQLPLLAGLFPEACFIHVIRDGRDVVSSLVATEWFSGGVEAAAEYWGASVRAGRQAGAALGPRYTELHYEELLEDPAATLARVCQFIGLSYSPAMLDYRASAEAAIAMALHPQHHGSLRLAPTKGLRDWRRDMSPVDRAVVWLVAGPMLSELGYSADDRRISVEARWRVLRRRSRATVRSVRSRLRVFGSGARRAAPEGRASEPRL